MCNHTLTALKARPRGARLGPGDLSSSSDGPKRIKTATQGEAPKRMRKRSTRLRRRPPTEKVAEQLVTGESSVVVGPVMQPVSQKRTQRNLSTQGAERLPRRLAVPTRSRNSGLRVTQPVEVQDFDEVDSSSLSSAPPSP